MTFSHQFSRLFQLDKIQPPRDFLPMSSDFWQINVNNICLEIGAGKGKHALQFAKNNPNFQLIAIERTEQKFVAMQKVANAETFTNLTVIHADAVAWAVHGVPKQSLAQIFILYPNPEPHNPNQRWLNMPFFEFLLSRLQPNGKITLASNIADYIDEAYQKSVDIWQLPTLKSQVPTDSERTHFEVKYLARGETCWQLDITKPSDYCTRFDDV